MNLQGGLRGPGDQKFALRNHLPQPSNLISWARSADFADCVSLHSASQLSRAGSLKSGTRIDTPGSAAWVVLSPTTRIPAESAAFTPVLESSSTMQFAGGTPSSSAPLR